MTPGSVFQFIKHGHVFIVGTGLVLFWVPLFAPKGGPVHRAAGKLYVAFMSVAGISGAGLAASYLWTPSKRLDGAFLLCGVLAYFTLGWHAWRALRCKPGPHLMRRPFDIGLDVSALASGLAAFTLGLRFHDAYLTVIGPISVLIGARHLRVMFRKAHKPDWWRREHRAGMIATGITGYSALVFFEILR